MTRKDYRLIASAIRAERALMESNPAMTQAEIDETARITSRLADRLADVLAYDNPRFNRETFLAACSFDRDKG